MIPPQVPSGPPPRSSASTSPVTSRAPSAAAAPDMLKPTITTSASRSQDWTSATLRGVVDSGSGMRGPPTWLVYGVPCHVRRADVGWMGPSRCMGWFSDRRASFDPGRDRRAELDRPAHRAQPVVGLAYRVRQPLARLVALLAVREGDAKRHLQAGEVMSGRVAGLIRRHDDLERVRLGPPRGEQVHVDRRAAADRDQQQLDRGEVGPVPGPDADLPAALVDRGVPAVLDPFQPHAAMCGICCHVLTVPHTAARAAAACRGRVPEWPGDAGTGPG